jgi:hypothetical protein
MAVTDEQVAALRAHLMHDFAEAGRLNRRLAEAGDDGYGAFVRASFVLAARRRFAPEWTIPQIVKYVATARAHWGRDAADIDPGAAETLLRQALNDDVIVDPDLVTRGRVAVFLLTELIAAEELDETGLDGFLAEARNLADYWLLRRR